MAWIWAIVLWLVGYIFGVLTRAVAPYFSDKAQEAIVRFLGKRSLKFGKFTSLAGEWNHIWYGGGSWPHENPCEIVLSAWGRRFYGVYDYRDSKWFVSGRLGPDGMIVGRWGQVGADGYNGSWMGKVDLNYKQISGWYLGPSIRAPGIGAGEWIWWRKNEPRPTFAEIIVQTAQRPDQE